MMLELFTRNWWAPIVRGIVAILFGVLAFRWPGLTLFTLVLLFGAFAVIDGIFALVMAVGGWSKRDDHWLLLLEGLFGCFIGVLAYRAPGLTVVTLVLYIAAWSLITGVLKIVSAIRLRKEMEHEWLLILSGLLSLAFALVLMARPIAGALAMTWLIGIYAIVLGVMQIIFGFQLHSAHRRLVAAPSAPAAPAL